MNELGYPPLSIRIWGQYACFTRPEMKVERVSYPVPTASAARGILEAVFWKPEFRWEVLETKILRPIRYASVLRNEIKTKTSLRTVQSWVNNDGHYVAAQDHTPRHTLALQDVEYVITARMRLAKHTFDHPAKYRDQFRRRVKRGQCYARPYLGCREFAAYFGPADGSECPIDATMDLGSMLWDLEYVADGSGRGRPVFFQAQLRQGVIRYPIPEEVQ